MSPRTDANAEVTQHLEAAGLLWRDGDDYRTTRRWQGAMARAAWRLLSSGDRGEDGDLRLPVAHALMELLGNELPDEELARCVEVMVPVEAAELDPRARIATRASPPGPEPEPAIP